jgi:cell division protein FtsB
VTTGRWVALVILLLALVFGMVGGEYSIFDLRTMEREAAREQDSVAVLTRAVDSLDEELEAILTDPAVQERIAREKWGMLRDGEFVFRVQRDSVPGRAP